jgi:UDP-N-acetylglucosamine acyltransferase
MPFSKTSAERGTSASLSRSRASGEIRRSESSIMHIGALASKLNTSQAIEKLKEEADRGEDVDRLIQFVQSSERGVVK